MKNSIFLLLAIIGSSILTDNCFAQAPSGFTYQSVIRDSNNDLVINTAVGVQISILQTSSIGAAVYVETHSVSTNVNGLLSLEVGGGSVVSGTFSTIAWGSDSYYVKSETDPTGGTTYTITGTQQLMSVPYALYAETSGSGGAQGATGPQGPSGADGIDGNDGATGATGPLVSGTSGQTLRHNGSDWVATSNLYNAGTNVGIGTTAPASQLEISNASGAATARLTGTGSGNYATHSVNSGYDIVVNSSAWTDFNFRALPGNHTSGAGYLFGHQSGSAGDNYIYLYEPNSSTISTQIGTGNKSSYVNSQGGNFGVRTATPDAGLHVYNSTLQVGNYKNVVGTRLTITSSGNIKHTYGKNDGSETYARGRFEIKGNAKTTVLAGTDAGAYITRAGNGRWGAIAGSSTGGLNFVTGGTSPATQNYDDLSASLAMIIDDAGNVGIGEPAPDATLDVVGTFQLDNGAAAGDVLIATDAAGNTAWTDLATIGAQGPAGNDGATGATGPQGDAGTDDQLITLTGTNLSIEDGNTVDLSALQDGVDDADNDPANEIQNLSRTGTTVTLSNGGGTFQDSVGVYTPGTGIDITNNVISASDICGLSIGDTYQGGIIFYLDASGCHGLISASTDQSASIQWYNGSNVDTYAYGNGIGAGEGNSQGIRRWQGECSSCYASELCQDLSLGGYSDWYLPSKYELNLMYQNIGQGNALGLGNNVGGFASDYYWSSTEYGSGFAWGQLFYDGFQDYYFKLDAAYVRAIRAF